MYATDIRALAQTSLTSDRTYIMYGNVDKLAKIIVQVYHVSELMISNYF